MNIADTHTINLKEFPTTRYRGSKRKILPWISDSLAGLEYDSVLDLFGGTGSVSYMFKRMGKQVIYNDHLWFNHLIGKAVKFSLSATGRSRAILLARRIQPEK